MRKTRAQSVLEYLGVFVVCSGLGIGTFLAVNHAAVSSIRGTEDNYESTDTLLGKILDDATVEDETKDQYELYQP